MAQTGTTRERTRVEETERRAPAAAQGAQAQGSRDNTNQRGLGSEQRQAASTHPQGRAAPRYTRDRAPAARHPSAARGTETAAEGHWGHQKQWPRITPQPSVNAAVSGAGAAAAAPERPEAAPAFRNTELRTKTKQ